MDSQKTIVFATSNKGKFSWLERAVKIAKLDHIQVEQKKMDLVEIQSNDLAEISLYKAKQAYEAVGKPVIVMDGGFYINALNGFPGPFIRFMLEQMGIDRIAKLVGTLDDRSCNFRNVVTYMDGTESYQQFQDTTGGIYTMTDQVWPEDHPQQWSAMWRILVPSGMGYTKPLAALSEEELQIYAEKRAQLENDSSALNSFVDYLAKKEMQKNAAA